MGLALFAAMPVFAQQKATINVHPEQGKEINEGGRAQSASSGDQP